MRDFFDDLNDWIYRTLPIAIVITWLMCVIYLVRGLVTGAIR